MRLGGPTFCDIDTPEKWIAALQAKGYRAAYWHGPPEGQEQACVQAAAEADIVIAEVGAWCNPISPDETQRTESLAFCKAALATAERIGARCCVNISGSWRVEKWDCSHPKNLTDETFDRIVDSVREIIDAVQPTRTFYTLEPMPFMYPDSVDSYVRLIEAIDRERFAVHFDPVNLISSPQRYFNTGKLISEFVDKLGPHIRSCHAKDTILRDGLTTHLDECCPGTGNLDYHTYLRELDRLGPDMTLYTEHLETEADFDDAAAHIRGVAAEIGVTV